MNVMLAIVDAQRDYISEDRDKSGVREYARKFVSTAGRKDGLYWPTKTGQPESPLGTLVARATAEGYPKDSGPRPYHGYYFRMLKGQGSNAKGGALDYVVRDRMIGGFAAIAYPARYGNSGVMTFMVNQDGDVYEKDLGPGHGQAGSRNHAFRSGYRMDASECQVATASFQLARLLHIERQEDRCRRARRWSGRATASRKRSGMQPSWNTSIKNITASLPMSRPRYSAQVSLRSGARQSDR